MHHYMLIPQLYRHRWGIALVSLNDTLTPHGIQKHHWQIRNRLC